MGLLSASVIKASVGGKSKTVVSKSGGNQWNLGGTVVINTKTGDVVFQHLQKGYADHVDPKTLLAACEPPADDNDNDMAAIGAAMAAVWDEANSNKGEGEAKDTTNVSVEAAAPPSVEEKA